jgi:hypothetical protein
MRWTGLAIGDAMRLRKETLEYDASKDLYRIKTSRQKTGVPVANPIPHELAVDRCLDTLTTSSTIATPLSFTSATFPRIILQSKPAPPPS